MTILARSDHAGGSITVSRDMGGCGELHKYAIGSSGFPELTCALCEDFLRHDPCHSMLASEVPETHDEEVTRGDWEKRGAADQQYIQAIVMAKAFGLEVPDSFNRMSAGGRRTLPGSVCGNGHQAAAGAKFCPECAAPMTPEVVRCGAGHANAPDAKFCSECAAPMGALVAGSVVPDAAQITAPKRRPALKDMRLADLQDRCRQTGLDVTGNRAVLIARLRAAK